jgi:hypothetical protein
MGFVANDLRGSVTIFWVPFFRVFPTVNPINKACCNCIMLMLYLIFMLSLVGCWSCRCKSNWLQGCSCVKQEGMMSIVS